MTTSTLRAATTFATFVLSAITVLGIIHWATAPRIALTNHQTLATVIQSVLPTDGYNNDPVSDMIWVSDPALGTTRALPVYRARQSQLPIAAVITAIAPNGYNGAITVMVGVHNNGEIIGVRIASHKETPGLGDDIDVRRSNWIYTFNGKSLATHKINDWRVKKDGGQFDQFTGATVTPRAVVECVRRVLSWYENQQNTLYDIPAGEQLNPSAQLSNPSR